MSQTKSNQPCWSPRSGQGSDFILKPKTSYWSIHVLRKKTPLVLLKGLAAVEWRMGLRGSMSRRSAVSAFSSYPVYFAPSRLSPRLLPSFWTPRVTLISRPHLSRCRSNFAQISFHSFIFLGRTKVIFLK